MPTLDTSFLVDLIRKKPEALVKIEALEAKGSPLETTTVNILELYKGVYISESVQYNMLEVQAILKAVTELVISDDTYEMFGSLAAQLRQNGRPIGDFDELIVAITLCNDGVIVTRDRHFSRIPGLAVETY